MLVDVAATLGSGSDTVRPVQPPSAAATAMASMAEGPARNFVCMRGIEKRRLTRIRTTRPPVRGAARSGRRLIANHARLVVHRGRWPPACGVGAPPQYKRRDAAHQPPAPV